MSHGTTLDNLQLTDTFHTWFIRHNQTIDELNTVIGSGISTAGLSGTHLWITTVNGSQYDAGNVKGPTGKGISAAGMSGSDLVLTWSDSTTSIIGDIKGDQGVQGVQGEQGPAGNKGEAGNTGIGVPAGGTQGYVLTKGTSGDYDTEWTDISATTKPKPGYIGGRAFESNKGVRPQSYIYLPDVHSGVAITADVMKGFTVGISNLGGGINDSKIYQWTFNDELSSTGGMGVGCYQEGVHNSWSGWQGPSVKLIPMYIPSFSTVRRFVMWIDDIGTMKIGGHTSGTALAGSGNTFEANHITEDGWGTDNARFYSHLHFNNDALLGVARFHVKQPCDQGIFLRMALLSSKNREPDALVQGSTAEFSLLPGSSGWQSPKASVYKGSATTGGTQGSHTDYYVTATGPHGFTMGAGSTGVGLPPGWYWLYFECIPQSWISNHPVITNGQAGDAIGGSGRTMKKEDRLRTEYTTIFIPHTDVGDIKFSPHIGHDLRQLSPPNVNDVNGVGITGADEWKIASDSWSNSIYLATNGLYYAGTDDWVGNWSIVNDVYNTSNNFCKKSDGFGDVSPNSNVFGIQGIGNMTNSGNKALFHPANKYQARIPRVGLEIYKSYESSEEAEGGGGPFSGGA